MASVFRLLFILLLMTPSQGRADGVLVSDFVFQLDQSYFNSPEFSFAGILQGQERFERTEIQIFDQVPIKLRNVVGEIQYNLDSAVKNWVLGAEHNVVSNQFSVMIRIGEVELDSIVERKVGGALVRARVKASCKNVKLELPAGRATIMGSITTAIDGAGLPSLSLPWFRAEWTADAWELHLTDCQGASGFAQRLTLGLKDYLKDPHQLSAEFKKALRKRVAEIDAAVKREFLKKKSLSVGIEGVQAVLYPEKITGLKEERFKIEGRLEVRFVNPDIEELIELRRSERMDGAEAFTLSVPDDFLHNLNLLAFKSGFYRKRKLGREIEAFRRLRSSWLMGWFVWPEVMRFDRKVDFVFDFWTSAVPKLASFKLNARGELQGQVSMTGRTQVWAPVAQQVGFERFSTFEVPLLGNYTARFENERGPELRVRFNSLSLNIGHQWDPVYQQKQQERGEWSAVNTRAIQKELKKSLINEGIQIPLDTLRLNEKRELVPILFKQSPGWLQIQFR
jgi:hypothetical protein